MADLAIPPGLETDSLCVSAWAITLAPIEPDSTSTVVSERDGGLGYIVRREIPWGAAG